MPNTLGNIELDLMKKFILPVLFLLIACSTFAQEFEFKITINTPKLQTTDPKVFETLESTLVDFLNNYRWTEDDYENFERIKCDIQLTIKEELPNNGFTAEMAIQAVRPIYGSSEETALLSHLDKNVTFTYEQFQPVDFTKNSFQDNLSSVFAFYVYTILGLDYDSFSPFGGEKFFQNAQDVLNTIPQNIASGDKGWRSLNAGRNRFSMIDNILTPASRPFRKAMYDYHRNSLDIMYNDVATARAVMLQALEEIDKVNKSNPNLMILQMFANSKSSEIVEIFKESNSREKTRVYQIMTKMDAANASKYRAIRR